MITIIVIGHNWIMRRTLSRWILGSNLPAAAAVPSGKACYPHCLVPRKGFIAVGPLVACPLAAEAQKFRGTGVVFARAPGLRKYKVARATPKKADEQGGGGGGDSLSGQFPDIIYIIG